ncbi:MAG: hypothetical protein H6Q70_4713 [Firmicutes bacterium]|nr:hypothetical protein [Bacillota bacterium]
MQKKIRQYVGMTLGIFITAVAMNLFLIPHKIAAGGIGGVATVLHYLFDFPVGLIMLLFNIPIFIVGLKILGTRYGINTLYGAIMLSVFIDITGKFTPVVTEDILLNCLYGGVMVGVGMGLVFRFKGNTAGTALLAAILNKLFHISVGQALLIADGCVVAFAGIVFQSPELALYATIAIFVTSQIIDLVQEGPATSKSFLIMAENPGELADKIFQEIDRGVTYLQGRGGYTGQSREMLLCVVNTSEVTQLKELIVQHDSKAFIIVNDAHEVFGEGFTSYERKKNIK